MCVVRDRRRSLAASGTNHFHRGAFPGAWAVLTVAPLASGQAHYYLSLTASAYYTQAPEPEGSWHGLGAEEFGLKGTVKADDLIKLCEGYDPQDPARHVRNAGQHEGPRARKHGDDLCFSAPKSVSVAWAL